jgi:hypothetical protein
MYSLSSALISAQAEAFAVNNIDCFQDPHDDPHKRYVSGFITSVCTFLGTVPPPLVTLDADEVAAFKSNLEARERRGPPSLRTGVHRKNIVPKFVPRLNTPATPSTYIGSIAA